MKTRKIFISFLLVLFTMGAEVAELRSLDNVIAGDHRSEQNKSRDDQRNQKQTLEFFGIQSNMTVVEVWPSGGWYTEILRPILTMTGNIFLLPLISTLTVLLSKGWQKYFLVSLKRGPIYTAM